MSQLQSPRTSASPPMAAPPPSDDPCPYGYRYVNRTNPDGTVDPDIVPLSYEDVLHPQEDDYVPHTPIHDADIDYCGDTLKDCYVGDDSVVVLRDCLVNWNVRGMRALAADTTVLFGVRRWLKKGTFHIRKEGGKPILAIEITSPCTYENDLERKPDLYYRAGIQRYLIIDRGPQSEDPVRLLGYDRGPQGWVPMVPDAQGRLDLSPIPLWIGIENDGPRFYDAVTGAAIPNHTEAKAQRTAAEKEAGRAKTKARRAETKARRAEAKAIDEAKAREEAEAKVRRAEAKALEAETAKAVLAERLRQLEEQLRGFEG